MRKQNKPVRNDIDPVAFMPERLIHLREKMGLNRTQAAELLQLSKMAYGRYEKGERIPSYQYLVYISQKMGTSPEYLVGKTDDESPKETVISKEEEPLLFEIASGFKEMDDEQKERLLTYYRTLSEMDSEEEKTEE